MSLDRPGDRPKARRRRQVSEVLHLYLSQDQSDGSLTDEQGKSPAVWMVPSFRGGGRETRLGRMRAKNSCPPLGSGGTAQMGLAYDFGFVSHLSAFASRR